MSRPIYRIPWLIPWNTPYNVYILHSGTEEVKNNYDAIEEILSSEQCRDCEVYVRLPVWRNNDLIDGAISERLEISQIQPNLLEGLHVYHSDMVALGVVQPGLNTKNLRATILWDKMDGKLYPKRFIVTTQYTWMGFNYGNAVQYDPSLLGEL